MSPFCAGSTVRPAAAPGDAPDHLEHVVDRDARAAANIVYAARRRPGSPPRSSALTASATKVKSRVCSPSPKTRDRLSENGRAQELVKAHVGTLPRAVDGEIAQRHGRHAVVGVIEVAELLGRQLRDAVRRDRLRQRVFAHRHRDACRRRPTSSTHTRGARVDGFVARLEQHLRRLDVVHGIDREIASPAFPHAGLRGEVKHVRAIGEQRGQIGVLNPRLDEPEARLRPTSAARLRSLIGRG